MSSLDPTAALPCRGEQIVLVQRDALTGTPPSWGSGTARSSSQTANVLVDVSLPEELCHPWPAPQRVEPETDPVVSPPPVVRA